LFKLIYFFSKEKLFGIIEISKKLSVLVAERKRSIGVAPPAP